MQSFYSKKNRLIFEKKNFKISFRFDRFFQLFFFFFQKKFCPKKCQFSENLGSKIAKNHKNFKNWKKRPKRNEIDYFFNNSTNFFTIKKYLVKIQFKKTANFKKKFFQNFVSVWRFFSVFFKKKLQKKMCPVSWPLIFVFSNLNAVKSKNS